MKNIGKIKSRLLGKLTSSYSNQDKAEMKELIKLIKENKEFVELYLFYEEIEGKYIADKEIAKQYIEEIIPILKNKLDGVSNVCERLDKKIGNSSELFVPVYDDLDKLLEEDSLSNIDKKLLAKKNLLEHLTTKKDVEINENTVVVQNENLFYAILAGNFNLLFENELTEDEKKEVQEYLSSSDKEISSKVEGLREEILNRVSNILKEDVDAVLQEKLLSAKREVEKMSPSKYNLYKLTQLKNGLF